MIIETINENQSELLIELKRNRDIVNFDDAYGLPGFNYPAWDVVKKLLQKINAQERKGSGPQ